MKKLMFLSILLFLSFPVFTFSASFPTLSLWYAESKGYLNVEQSFQSSAFPQSPNRAYLASVTDAENKAKKDEKPPLSGGRIVGEIIAGVGLGGSFGLAGAGICLRDENDVATAFSGLIAYTIGSAIGVYLGGNRDNETGNFSGVLIGSTLGTLIGLGVGSWLSNLYFEPNWTIFAAIFSAPISATAVFNLTRRYKSPPDSKTSLINFRDSKLSLAVPSVYFRDSQFDGFRTKLHYRGTLVQNTNLVRVDF